MPKKKVKTKSKPEPKMVNPPERGLDAAAAIEQVFALGDGVQGSGDTVPGTGGPAEPPPLGKRGRKTKERIAWEQEQERLASLPVLEHISAVVWGIAGRSIAPPDGFSTQDIDALAKSYAEAGSYWCPSVEPKWLALVMAGATTFMVLAKYRKPINGNEKVKHDSGNSRRSGDGENNAGTDG